MKLLSSTCTSCCLLLCTQTSESFQLLNSNAAPQRRRTTSGFISNQSQYHQPTVGIPSSISKTHLQVEKDGNNEEEEEYPYELEFINYDDPDYQVDQGLVEGEDFYPEDLDEAEIEKMREERRVQNDLYQFNTYFQNFYEEKEWFGEWTEYASTTFLDDFAEDKKRDANGLPRLVKGKKTVQVVTSATLSRNKDNPVLEFIQHSEKKFIGDESDVLELQQYVPEQLHVGDFRGPQGVMCVGNAYTVCHTISKMDDPHEGPFKEFRIEVGITNEKLRLRLKLDYSCLEQLSDINDEKLHLRKFFVCRERVGKFPSKEEDGVLFNEVGAPNGLYDPPPIGDVEQQMKYMTLDLEGGATVLFPFFIDQDEVISQDINNWCVTLDWTPSQMRYQVDRKFLTGSKLKTLRTLELSEVQAESADDWRPRDGGSDMRQ